MSISASEEEIHGLLVGPDSAVWRYASDVRLYFVMLYPLLLQVAHPTVGAGVRDYSDFERRPWQRLLATIDYVSLLVYGGTDAIAAGRRLRALHKGFRGTKPDGTRYSALEPEAYAWVHATLIETYIEGHRLFGSAMSAAEIERFYREYRGLGRLIGVRERDLPESWSDFRSYFHTMVDTRLERNESVDRVLSAIRHAPPPPVPVPGPLWRTVRIPAARALWLGGIGVMIPGLRARFGVRWTRADESQFRAISMISRRLEPVLPAAFKVTGPGQLRWRAEAIARGPLGAPVRESSVTPSSPGVAA